MDVVLVLLGNVCSSACGVLALLPGFVQRHLLRNVVLFVSLLYRLRFDVGTILHTWQVTAIRTVYLRPAYENFQALFAVEEFQQLLKDAGVRSPFADLELVGLAFDLMVALTESFVLNVSVFCVVLRLISCGRPVRCSSDHLAGDLVSTLLRLLLCP